MQLFAPLEAPDTALLRMPAFLSVCHGYENADPLR